MAALVPHRIIVTRPDGSRTTSWRTDDGLLEDPSDGTPAVVVQRPDGVVVRTEHWQGGVLDDPDEGTPAVWVRPMLGAGAARVEHWKCGHRRVIDQ